MQAGAAIPTQAMAELSGLDQLRGLVDGRFPQPTMDATLGFRLVAVDEGRAVIEGAPTAAMLNPFGTVHGGWAASVLDSALGYAIHSTLAPGEYLATLEIKINLTRAIQPGMAGLTATGTIVTRGRRVAVSEARMVDGEGRIYAHGSCTCLLLAL